MFQTDEYVFYGSGGICRITAIQTAPLDNMPADRQYYVMESIHDKNGVIYIPVDSECIFLRRLLNRAEAEALLNEIPSVEAIEESNAKLLRNRYTEAMRTHEPLEWVRVIKTVYRRAKEKSLRAQRLSETERSFAESAKRYLYGELALALGLHEADMEEYITTHIRNMA